MKKIFTLPLGLLMASASLFAQNKKYTMQDAVLGLFTDLAPQNITHISWSPDKDAFTELQKDEDNAYLLKTNVPSMKKDTLFSLSTINEQLFKEKPLKGMPQMNWFSKDDIYFKYGSTFYRGKEFGGLWKFEKWQALPKGTDNYFIHPESKMLAYTTGNNLFLIDSYGKKHSITQDEDKGVVNGQVVSRHEFGIDKGIFLSPKGNFVAFYRKDETKVDDHPIVFWDEIPAHNRNIKYPMAGRTSELVSLGIYNPITQKTVFMQTGDDIDHYLTNITWSPDEKHIYIGILQRNQKEFKLNKYNTETGAFVQTLFEEKNEKYIRPMHPLHFIPGNDNEFIWLSEREGFTHLYRYNTNGKLLKKLTSGDWVVNEINGWNKNKNEIVISTTAVSPLNKNIFIVNWETGKMRRWDNGLGTHNALVNNTGTYLIDRYTDYETPRAIKVVATESKWEKSLLNAPNTLTDFQQPTVKQLTLKAADNQTTLYGRLILPPDFDSTKKYPVVVYLYNGPGVQLIKNRYPASGNLWYDYMAQNGFIVFTMDGRGSGNRGLAFEQTSYRNLGTHEMEDQLKGVEFLKSLPYVDANRMGVHGWSYGGFMSISLMLRHPDVFKCAVAGGPVIDWRMYEIMYTERFMDSPQDNPEGYAASSLLDKTKNLKGDLLVIHGAMDSTVVLQHSMKFLRECVKENVYVDYYVYPAHPHNVRGKDRVHLMQKVTDYFMEHLK